MKDIKIKEFVSYNGHTVKANGVVNLNFKAMYSELVNTIQTLQLLNNDVKIAIGGKGKEQLSLGMFRVKNVNVSDDGESVLKFETLSDSAEMDVINSLVGKEGEFVIYMTSKVDEEDTEETEETTEEAEEDDEASDDEWDEIDEDEWGDEDE